MESSLATLAPLLLRNLMISVFIYGMRSLAYLSQKSKLVGLIRGFLASILLFVLNPLPASLYSWAPSQESPSYALKSANHNNCAPSRGEGNSGVSRALAQLLLLMNGIPVSSRKYEVVRSLIEKLIDENLAERSRPLREVNCAVLSAAFSRTLNQLESAMVEQEWNGGGEVMPLPQENGPSRLLRGFSKFGRTALRYAKSGSEMSRSGNSAEKLAAELLWLAQKMAASGSAEEAVCKWAAASKLAQLALSVEPRLQGSLVKVSAYLIEQAKDIGKEQEEDGNEGMRLRLQVIRETKVKLLVSWLPLLCHAHNGTDAPILSLAGRAEIEKILGEIISTLEEDEQEMVLAIWLHHFTYSPASDWPNMGSCYTQWYNASRTRLLAAASASVN